MIVDRQNLDDPHAGAPRRAVANPLARRFILATMVLAAASAMACAFVAASDAQTVRQDLDIANGAVGPIVVSGNTLYIGGNFTYVGPETGGGVPVGAATGTAIAGFPKVAGAVLAVVSDGAGGWYIGGSFTSVGGIARSNLAHILADNSVSSWNPNCDGQIVSLAVSGSTVYAAGFYSSIGGAARSYLAALDAITGLATPWNPNPNSIVRRVAVGGGTIYAGGTFNAIGGQSRSGIAALDPATGLATDWDPYPVHPDTCCAGNITALALSGSTLYVGGNFNHIGGKPRARLGAVDVATGLATDWDPAPSTGSGTFIVTIKDLSVGAGTVYVGGIFENIGGQARNGLAAVDAASGMATGWNPNPEVAPYFSGPPVVAGLLASGSVVYVGGFFSRIAGETRISIAAIDAATGLATSWNPKADYEVNALAANATTVFVGGPLTSVGGEARSGIAAIDLTTGHVTDWNPSPNNAVYTMDVNGPIVYAGGEFTVIGGQQRNHIAALDAASGQATGWDPNANGWVSTLVASGPLVYVGGGFAAIRGQLRSCIAALDATTGLATAWDPSANGQVLKLLVNGSSVYVTGQFSMIGGQSRNYIASLDASSGQATSWNPNANGNVLALALDGSTLYVGGDFTTIGGQARSRIAALDATTGALSTWNPNANEIVGAILPTGATVYVGGAFTSIAGQTRNRVASLDAATGSASLWDPNADGPVGTLTRDAQAIYLGGTFTSIGDTRHSGIAAVGDVTTPTLLALVSAEVMPGRVQLVWFSESGVSGDATVYRRSDATDWRAIGRTSQDGTGRLAYQDRDALAAGRYGYRLGVTRNGAEALMGEAWVNVTIAPDLALSCANPVSSGGDLVVDLSLPAASPARLDLFDITGRRVASREVGTLGAGNHRVGLAPAGALAPGLYLVHLTQARRAVTARLAVIR